MCKKTNHPDQTDLFSNETLPINHPGNPFSPENLERYRQERKRKTDETMAALMLLCETAQGGSGQCHHVRRFLLGLYNCDRWPFELNRLRVLDKKLKDACFKVLDLDVAGYQEIHTYIKNGDELWRKWWKMEDNDQ